MKPIPANKTAIISFIIDELIEKLWNLSTDMRKRLRWILKNMNVTVRNYNKKSLVLNGWVIQGEGGQLIKELAEMKKGISNYNVETQEQLDKILSLNGGLRCCQISFLPETPIEFDWIGNLELNLSNFENFSKCSVNKIGRLVIFDLSADQISQILSKVKQIDHLILNGLTLSELDLKRIPLKILRLNSLKLTGNLILPANLKHLDLKQCKNLKHLKTKGVTEIEFAPNEEELEYQLNWLKNQKGLKEIGIERLLSTSYNYFPSTVRIIKWPTESDCEKVDLTEMKKKLPYLLSIDDQISIEVGDKLNLRKIDPIINQTSFETSIRPRKITVNSENCSKLSQYSEIFERVEIVVVDCDLFNFDCLTERIKQIWIYDEVDLASKVLSRF